MKAYDIILQLQSVIPFYTDKFSEKISISTLTKSGAVATATATAHGLINNDKVCVTGAVLNNPVTITRIGNVATAVSTYQHDLTLFKTTTYINISGSVQADYNGTKKLLSVQNKNTFTFEVLNSPATPATGSPILNYN
jgi:hypothetical protein